MKVTYEVTIGLENAGRLEVGVLNLDDKNSENLKSMGHVGQVADIPILAAELVAEAIERSMYYRIQRVVGRGLGKGVTGKAGESHRVSQ